MRPLPVAVCIALGACQTLEFEPAPPVPLADAAADAAAPTDAHNDVQPGDASVGADAGPTYRDIVLADHPVAYWRLGEAPGQLYAHDETNHGNEGTFVGGIDLAADGAIPGDTNTAIRNDATGKISVGDKVEFAGNTPLSLEAWIAVEGGEPAVIDKTDYRLFFWNSGVRFDHSGDTYCPCIAFEGDGGALIDGKYHHIVATYDKVTMNIYVDGVRAQNCACAATLPESDAGLVLGEGLSGRLDEVAIYDVALPLQSVQKHFAAATHR